MANGGKSRDTRSFLIIQLSVTRHSGTAASDSSAVDIDLLSCSRVVGDSLLDIDVLSKTHTNLTWMNLSNVEVL